jgi:hypothetical protein
LIESEPGKGTTVIVVDVPVPPVAKVKATRNRLTSRWTECS